MAEPQPLACVFFKLPPSYQTLSQIYDIGWNVFVPQLSRLDDAFKGAQATYPSAEVKKIWSDARRGAAEKVAKLPVVNFANENTAFNFLRFLDALHSGRDNSEAYHSFRARAREAVVAADIAQKELLNFREDIRIAVGRITSIMSGDGRDVSSLITESSQSLLELATGVEECNALLEEFRDESGGVQGQSVDEKTNPPSEEEFRMVREKWKASEEFSKTLEVRWEALVDQIRGYRGRPPPEDSSEPVTMNNPMASTMAADSPKSPKVPFWRKFFRRILSCLS